MMRLLTVLLAGLTALLPAGKRDEATLPSVTIVAEPRLRDVAVALYDSLQPKIYFNPVVMAHYGPSLSTFFLVHEYGHIVYHHTRASALRVAVGTRDSLLRAKEFDADCFATRWLSHRDREAVDAAVRFFSKLGNRSYDTEHPTGARRAAHILECMNPS